MKLAQENQLDFAGPDFSGLFACARATAFQSPIWLDCFYRYLAPSQGAEPLIVTVRDGGELVGVIPMIRRRKAGLRLVESTDLGVSDYSAPVLRDDLAQRLESDTGFDLKRGFLDALGSHDILRIRPVRDEHRSEWGLLLNTEAMKQDFSAHCVALTPPFDDWRKENLDEKLAGMVARKGRRWKKQHDVKLECLADADDITAAISKLVDLRAGRFEGDPIQQDEVKQFYQSVAVRGATCGDCETWRVSSDGLDAGVLFGLTYQGRFLYLLIGVDYDAHGRHSPGLQMYDWIIEDWMARGGTGFDFTIGDEPFKQQFGTQAEPMYGYLAANSSLGKLGLKLFAKRLGRGSDG